jgi:short subunit dehydrogenase-like uncharacterized protein
VSDRPFDIVVYGATGFTGRQAARYLAEHAPEGLRWTIAGRRAEALEQLAGELGLEAAPIVADSTDEDSVDAMVGQARVLLTTAGPFARYGTPVVAACVHHKTHYVDITGESPWVARMAERFHDTAREDGTAIVPFCGFDSVPSDLGTWFTARALQERTEGDVGRVTAAFAVYGGGLNGGTLASMLHLAEQFPARDLADPFLLVPGRTTREQWAAHADPRRPVYDPQRERWMMPFFMGPVNTRVVRRSAWLLQERGEGYGPDFAYQEFLDVKKGSRTRAWGATLALGAGLSLVQQKLGRKLLEAVGPSPGEGPSDASMDRGGFRVIYRAEAADGATTLTARMECEGDAGNRSTVRFLAEAALTLAVDTTALDLGPGKGGVLTPAVALGGPYLERLRARGVRMAVS